MKTIETFIFLRCCEGIVRSVGAWTGTLAPLFSVDHDAIAHKDFLFHKLDAALMTDELA